MEKAKQVARDFLSKDGKHDTTVDQDVRSAVTEEHIRPQHHEDVTTAIKKDVHQDHHQTRIQPVTAKETLPEKHTHNVLPVENKTVEHGNAQADSQRLQQEASQYKNTTTTERTTHTSSVAPTMTGERIHHHVHEHIQPVIQKETIAPETVHTTVPIHEVHHNAAVHHDTTTLPAKTLEEFTSAGGANALKGRETRTIQDYEGCPKPLQEGPDVQRAIHGENTSRNTASSGENLTGAGYENQSFGGRHSSSGVGSTGGYENQSFGSRNTGTGAGSVGAATGAASAALGAHSHEHSNKTNLGTSGHHNISRDQDAASRNVSAGGLGGSASGGSANLTGKSGDHSTTGKPSFLDKLNPRKDADGDGKAGLLD